MSQSPLLFIHGWASNAQVWQNAYRNQFTYYYDTPQFPDFIHLEETIKTLSERMAQPLTLVGWSLGGMLAMQIAASNPERIAKLILVSSTPCFITNETYAAGLASTIVKRLTKKLAQDKWQTQLDFYKLMFSATEQNYAVQYHRHMAPLLANLPYHTLASGLDYLLRTDLRTSLGQISVPCDIIHGTADMICPVAAGQYLAKHLPKAKLHLLDGAGHIPFYTRARDFEFLMKESVRRD